MWKRSFTAFSLFCTFFWHTSGISFCHTRGCAIIWTPKPYTFLYNNCKRMLVFIAAASIDYQEQCVDAKSGSGSSSGKGKKLTMMAKVRKHQGVHQPILREHNCIKSYHKIEINHIWQRPFLIKSCLFLSARLLLYNLSVLESEIWSTRASRR